MRLQGLAQAADVHVHRAFLHVDAAAPHLVQQLRAAVHAFGMGHEEMQQAVFGGADLHRHGSAAGLSASGREHAMRGAVDAQAADLHAAVFVVFARTTHHCADAGQQFARGKRLDHVVVDAGLQPANAVVLFAARGQHDDRDVAGQRFAAPAAGQFQPAGTRQHPVQQDQVGDALADRGLRLAGVASVRGFEIALAQGIGDHVADGWFVIDDQDAFLHVGQHVCAAIAALLPLHDGFMTEL